MFRINLVLLSTVIFSDHLIVYVPTSEMNTSIYGALNEHFSKRTSRTKMRAFNKFLIY